MRGIFSITKIDRDRIHLVPVKKPHYTAYTHFLRNRMVGDTTPKIKRWLQAAKTNLDIEAELLGTWYPNSTPCEKHLQPVVVFANELPLIHSAFEYDLYVHNNKIKRVYFIHKLPLTKKRMAPIVSYMVAYHRKRLRGLAAMASKVRAVLQQYDWNNFDENKLKHIFFLFQNRLNPTAAYSFKKWMTGYIHHTHTPVPVEAFLNGRATLMDVACSRHDDIVSDAHMNTLTVCKEIYHASSRSTAFETLQWLSPWFETSTETDIACPVCLEPMSFPIVTRCSHTFCAACISKTSDSCPMCRQETKPYGTWNRCLTWGVPSIRAREHAVREALHARQVEYISEPVDDETYNVLCAREEDKQDWECHFDNPDVYVYDQRPKNKPYMLYQSQNFTLEQWENLLKYWPCDVRGLIHGRVDIYPSFRGSLFRSLSNIRTPSDVAPTGNIVSWDQRPPVDQFFTGSNKDAQTVNELLPITRMWLYNPRRIRTIQTQFGGKVTFAGERPVTLNKTNQADAVSLHRWPAGRVQSGALVITSSTKGCIPCMLRKARALCVDQCHVVCLDCPKPVLECAHDPCKPTWRTTLD